jgi:adenylate/nucleoside-diphosphate kinase
MVVFIIVHRSKGFILEGLPHFADEAAFLAELGLYPDAVVSLEVEDTDVIARLLPPRLARWRTRRNQKHERRRKRKEKKQKKREAKIAKRRSQLMKDAESRKAERLVSNWSVMVGTLTISNATTCEDHRR